MGVHYAHTVANRRSTSGGIVMCLGVGISCVSRTQTYVTLSSPDVEHVVMTTGICLTMFMRHVWGFVFLVTMSGVQRGRNTPRGRHISAATV